MESILKLLPIDNLYKFMAISGLITSLFCILYPEWRLSTISKNLVEVNGKIRLNEQEKSQLRGQIKDLDLLVKEFSEEVDKLIKEHSEYYKSIKMDKVKHYSYSSLPDMLLAKQFANKDFRDGMEFVIKNRNYLRGPDKLQSEIDSSRRSINTKGRALELKEIEYQTLKELSEMDRQRFDYLTAISAIGAILGLIVSAAGFLLWYDKHQLPQDSMLAAQIKNMKEEANSQLNS